MFTKTVSRIIVSAALVAGFVLAAPAPALALQNRSNNVVTVASQSGLGINDNGQQIGKIKKHNETEKYNRSNSSNSANHLETHQPEPNHPETNHPETNYPETETSNSGGSNGSGN